MLDSLLCCKINYSSFKKRKMFEDLKIGILGGGQLGAMLIRHAIDFGLHVAVLDKDSDAPCSRYTSSFHPGDPSSYQDVLNFGKGLDIITIEKEAVNIDALKELRDYGVKIYPSPEIIEVIQDKYIQKTFLANNEIPVAPGWLVRGHEDLRRHIEKLPAILKKCRNGYDGKGVMLLRNHEEISNAFDEPCVLEQMIDIKHELSVIVCRNEEGQVECYDPVLMIFNKERMILDFQMCPADIDKHTAVQARNIAIKTAEAFNLVGIMAVEMFLSVDGMLYVNELAPRPHNSGHHTIEACTTSQFEQLVRVILGLPLGATTLSSASVMMNLLAPAAYHKSAFAEAYQRMLQANDVHLHWYGKKSAREGRKMGHVTITGTSIENVMLKAIEIRQLLNGRYETK